MKKYIIGSVLILFVIIGYYFYKHSFKETPVVIVPTIEQQLDLPKDWSKITDNKSSLKLEKKIVTGLKPQIVLTVTDAPEASAPARYVDRLVAGARSAIPSLKIISDKRSSEEGRYSATIFGYYYNQKTKVLIIQRVYVKGETVSVLTGSYADISDAETINQILDSIVKQEKI